MTDIGCGGRHSLVCTRNVVYTFGHNRFTQLGTNDSTNRSTPTPVLTLHDAEVTQVIQYVCYELYHQRDSTILVHTGVWGLEAVGLPRQQAAGVCMGCVLGTQRKHLAADTGELIPLMKRHSHEPSGVGTT